MSGRDHLQPQLFDTDEYTVAVEAPPAPKMPVGGARYGPRRRADEAGYVSAHRGGKTMGTVWNNRIPEETDFAAEIANDRLWRLPGELEDYHQDEWVPIERITSWQPAVNEDAIQHQVEHANPLQLDQDPEFIPYARGGDGPEHFTVFEGNHRVNAAMRRGQLFTPGRVYRFGDDLQ